MQRRQFLSQSLATIAGLLTLSVVLAVTPVPAFAATAGGSLIQDTPGRVQACAQHADQHARGHAYGLRCHAPSITTAITYTPYGAIPLITIQGANFAPNSSVTVTVTSQSTTYRCNVSLTYATDRTGSFTSAPIQFGEIRQPSCLPATVTVSDAAGNSATATV